MTYHQDSQLTIHNGDALAVLRTMESESVQCCVTSPPYFGLRDYGVDGQIGLEPTPEEFIARLVDVFREVRRVLKDDGTLWVNVGDSYAAHEGQRKPTDAAGSPKQLSNAGSIRVGSRTAGGCKAKDLIGIPWMLAFALRADGWYLRSEIIWHKPNPMPESVKDRPTKAHEQIFLLSKSASYWYDADAVREPFTAQPGDNRPLGMQGGRFSKDYRNAQLEAQAGSNNITRTCAQLGRNRRSVWTVTTKPYSGAHFATFPPDLICTCILAGCPVGSVVLDPFAGSGTTAQVANSFGRKALLIELNRDYCELIIKRNCQKTIWADEEAEAA